MNLLGSDIDFSSFLSLAFCVIVLGTLCVGKVLMRALEGRTRVREWASSNCYRIIRLRSYPWWAEGMRGPGNYRVVIEDHGKIREAEISVGSIFRGPASPKLKVYWLNERDNT